MTGGMVTKYERRTDGTLMIVATDAATKAPSARPTANAGYSSQGFGLVAFVLGYFAVGMVLTLAGIDLALLLDAVCTLIFFLLLALFPLALLLGLADTLSHYF